MDSVDLVENDLVESFEEALDMVESLEETLFVAGDRDVWRSDSLMI